MSDEIIIIAPEIEPGAGGLADYTLRVVEPWRGLARVRFLIPRTADGSAAVPRQEVEAIERNAEALRSQLPAKGGKVLLQYSAYGFDQFGYPRWLLRALADWKRAAGGLLVIMMHEIWTFWPVLNKNYLVQQLHRRDLRHLLGHTDAVFTSTTSQAEHLRALTPGRTVQVLPVGSNILPAASTGEAKLRGVAVLFGLQGSRVRALQKMQDDLKALAAAGRIRKFVTAGGGNDAEGERKEHDLLDGIRLADGVEQRGALQEDKVSQLLSQATFGISAQDELSVTKSGTFMAYAAHGLNILSPFAGASRPEPLCWATHPAELLQGISDEQLHSRAEKLRNWQKATCSWAGITEQFARALQLELRSTRAAIEP